MTERICKLLMGLALVGFIAGCPGPKPKPTPPPDCRVTMCQVGFHCEEGKGCVPDPPQVVKFKELELRQADGVLTRNGQPHIVRGAIACCMEFAGSMWPGVGKPFVDYAIAEGSANMFHTRLGPFWADVEPEFATIGGAYTPDLSGWNPAFWQYQKDMAQYIGERGGNLQVDLIDGWGCKHTQWGERYTSWPAEDVNACGKQFTAKHKEFIRKAVTELDQYANVIWELGNENGQIDGFNPQYELDMVAEIRAAERFTAHMIGTNSDSEEMMVSPLVDMILLHKRSGIEAPWYGKYTANNEHNPEFTPAQEHALFCSAASAGQGWWAWRGGANDADYTQTLNLIRAGCDGFVPGECPFDVPAVTDVGCKPHGKTAEGYDIYDCTPLVNNSAYCRSAGFPDRSKCPLRPEGDPFRGACEIKSMGGDTPNYIVSGGSLALQGWHGGFQFILSGTGTGLVVCTVPSRGAANVCVAAGGGPLTVQR